MDNNPENPSQEEAMHIIRHNENTYEIPPATYQQMSLGQKAVAYMRAKLGEQFIAGTNGVYQKICRDVEALFDAEHGGFTKSAYAQCATQPRFKEYAFKFKQWQIQRAGGQRAPNNGGRAPTQHQTPAQEDVQKLFIGGILNITPDSVIRSVIQKFGGQQILDYRRPAGTNWAKVTLKRRDANRLKQAWMDAKESGRPLMMGIQPFNIEDAQK